MLALISASISTFEALYWASRRKQQQSAARWQTLAATVGAATVIAISFGLRSSFVCCTADKIRESCCLLTRYQSAYITKMCSAEPTGKQAYS